MNNDNLDLSKLMDQLQKMDKNDLQEGLLKASQIINSQNSEEINTGEVTDELKKKK